MHGILKLCSMNYLHIRKLSYLLAIKSIIINIVSSKSIFKVMRLELNNLAYHNIKSLFILHNNDNNQQVILINLYINFNLDYIFFLNEKKCWQKLN